MSNRETFIMQIQALCLPKIDLAGLTGLKPPKISEYIRGDKLPYGEAEKIEAAINAVQAVQDCLRPVRLDTSNPEGFWQAYEYMKTDGLFEKRKFLDKEKASQEAVAQ